MAPGIIRCSKRSTIRVNDRLEFDEAGNIKPVTPTHQGAFPKTRSSVSSPNLAYQAKVEASSYYDDNFKPSFAVDENNGTLWRPKGMGEEWLKIDLGKMQKIQTIWTQWEYGTQYYQYRIETSSDGTHWQLFADRSRNLHAGSPKIDVAPVVKGRNVPVKARYVKITFLGCQKQGYPGALWNVRCWAKAATNSSTSRPTTSRWATPSGTFPTMASSVEALSTRMA